MRGLTRELYLTFFFRFTPVSIETNVRVPVPSVDRAKCDFRNITAVVLDEDNGLYRLGTSQGQLQQLFTRNQFEPMKSNFLKLSQVPDTPTTIRSTATAASNSGGQGFFHCNCAQKCNSNRCKCLKDGFKCNSKCHNSSSCLNK